MTGELQTFTCPATPARAGAFGLPTDPLSLLLLGPFLPFFFLLQMQAQMMQGIPAMAGHGSGMKIVQIRRDGAGNIIEILERG